jgi:hypothetical protein
LASHTQSSSATKKQSIFLADSVATAYHFAGLVLTSGKLYESGANVWIVFIWLRILITSNSLTRCVNINSSRLTLLPEVGHAVKNIDTGV